ncbi:hypothetical protein ES703_60665 [subsurface metagenome]
MLTGFFDVLCVRVQAVNQVAVTGVQCSRQLPITTANMYNQATLDTCGIQDLLGCTLLCSLLRSCHEQDRDNCQDTYKHGDESVSFLHEYLSFHFEHFFKCFRFHFTTEILSLQMKNYDIRKTSRNKRISNFSSSSMKQIRNNVATPI